MSEKNLKELGSKTAKRGFRTEKDVVDKFNNWKEDSDAQKWLDIMGYPLNEIEKVKAIIISGSYKTDVQVQVTIFMKEAIDIENISVKLISNPQGFNQVDKRWVEKYVKLWNIPQEIALILKKHTGEIPPENPRGLRDPRRMYFNEMDVRSQKLILDFFEKNKMLIVSDITKGRGKFSADWMLIALKGEDENKWVLKPINKVMNIFAQGKVRFTKYGNLKIGQIGMQRKGGDAGRPTANMLQFKINPALLFES